MEDFKNDEAVLSQPICSMDEFLVSESCENIDISLYQDQFNNAIINIRSNDVNEAVQAYDQIMRFAGFNVPLPNSFFHEILTVFERQSDQLKIAALKALQAYVCEEEVHFIQQNKHFFEKIIPILFHETFTIELVSFLLSFIKAADSLAENYITFDYYRLVSENILASDDHRLISLLIMLYTEICNIFKQLDPDDVINILDYLSTLEDFPSPDPVVHFCSLLCDREYNCYFERMLHTPIVLNLLRQYDYNISTYVLLLLIQILSNAYENFSPICEVLLQNGLVSFIENIECYFDDNTSLLQFLILLINSENAAITILESGVLSQYLNDLTENCSAKMYKYISQLYIKLLSLYPNNHYVQEMAMTYLDLVLETSTDIFELCIQAIHYYAQALPYLVDRFSLEECKLKNPPERILEILAEFEYEHEDDIRLKILTEVYESMI